VNDSAFGRAIGNADGVDHKLRNRAGFLVGFDSDIGLLDKGLDLRLGRNVARMALSRTNHILLDRFDIRHSLLFLYKTRIIVLLYLILLLYIKTFSYDLTKI